MQKRTFLLDKAYLALVEQQNKENHGKDELK
jgi:hypothetical protein